MNHISFFWKFACVAFFCASAAWCAPHKDKLGQWVYDEFIFVGKKGEWDQSRNWRDNRVPKGELPRVNIMGGSSLTVSRPVAEVLSRWYLGLGSSQPTEVFFKKGAKLETGGMMLPTAYIADSTADFKMEGGELTVGKIKEHGYFLDIGTGATASGTARFTVSGGTLSVLSGMRVGSSLSGTNVGTFCVSGSQPLVVVSSEGSSGIALERSGTLEFLLDETGVCTIDARKAQLRLNAGATVRIDARAYKGASKNILLLQMRELVKLGDPRVEVLVSPPYKGEAVFEKNRLVLKVSQTSP